jgi:hypothetical protein
MIAEIGAFRAARDSDDPVVASRVVVDDPTREALWEEYFGPYLRPDDVRRQLGLTDLRQVHRLAKQRRLLAFRRGARNVYPSFQFTRQGEVDPTISQVVAILSEIVESPYTIASWLKSPKESLEGETPLRWLERGRDPAPVIEAARLTAARLAS